MAYGIQLSTSDGQKTDLNFQAGRLLAVSSETGVKEDRNHVPPAGITLSQVTVWNNTSGIWQLAFKYELNYAANRIEIRKHPNVSFDETSPGYDFEFYYIGIQ